MAVIPIVVLAAVAVVFLLFLSYQVWWRTGNLEESQPLLPVDLEAFRNLTDPQEADFLRAHLSAKDFRRIQRLRLRATAAYITTISQNAARLVVMGRSMSADPESETASAGLDVVHRALQLQVWCLLSRLRVGATFVFPGLLSPSSHIADRYVDVTSATTSFPNKAAA